MTVSLKKVLKKKKNVYKTKQTERERERRKTRKKEKRVLSDARFLPAQLPLVWV